MLCDALPGASIEDATAVMGGAMDEVSRNSDEEFVFLKKACQILELGNQSVCEALKPGVTENTLWAAAAQTLVLNGSWYGYFLIGTSGPNPTFLRGPASTHPLKEGDVVLFEADTIVGGVAPQMMYSFSLGKPDRDVGAMFQLCEELYHYALAELEKEKTYYDIEMDLVQRIHKAGYEPMTPQIHRFNMSIIMPTNVRPQPGDYFTLHPNISNKDYSAGAKVGDEVRITSEGKAQRLMQTPAKLNIL